MSLSKSAWAVAMLGAAIAFLIFGLKGAIAFPIGFAFGLKVDATIQAARRLAAPFLRLLPFLK